MQRRTVLKQCTAGLAAAGSFGLAGCGSSNDSGDSNGGGDSNDDAGSTPTDVAETDTDRPEQTAESVGGAVGQNTVDGLKIVDWLVKDTTDDFTVQVTVENTGQQTTDIFDYEYGLALYDESGADISTGGSGSGSIADTEIEPGEQSTINVFQSVEGSPDNVTSFEISLSCDGPFVEGVYCTGPSTPADSGPTNTGDVQGSVGQNDVPELTITDWRVVDNQQSDFTVDITVRNDGDKQTDIFDYEYGMTLYDASGADITGGGSGSLAVDDTDTAPGESADMKLMQSVDGDKSDVATYELTLGCDDFFSDGVYCE